MEILIGIRVACAALVLGVPLGAFANCKVVWAPPNEELAASGWFSGKVYTGGQARVSYDADLDAIAISQAKGVPKQLAEHRPYLPWARGNTARLTVEMFVAEDFIPNKNSRLAIGLRGGAAAISKKISGGATPDVQDGWSFRINHNAQFRLNAYSYHLNRATEFGTGYFLASSFPKGVWMTIELDATLNVPGSADGTAALTLKTSEGRLYDNVIVENLEWRRDGSWDSFGIILTDVVKRPPMQDQRILYRNFKLEVGAGLSCS